MVVRYGDTMVLVTAVAVVDDPSRRRLHAADGRLPREDLGRRAHPGRLLQARGPHDRGRGADLAPHRSSVAARCSPRAGASTRRSSRWSSRPTARTRSDVLAMTGASMRAAHQRHPVGGSVRGRARRPHRRHSSSSTRPSPQRADVGCSTCVVACQPRRHRHGRGQRRRGRRGRHRRRAHVRAPGGAAAASTCRRSCGPPSASRSASSRRRSRIRPSSSRVRGARQREDRAPPWPSATSTSATRALDAAGAETEALLAPSSPIAAPRSGEAYESAKKKHLRELVLDTGAPHRRARHRRHPRRSPARWACCRARTARRCSRAARRRRWSRPRSGTSQDAQHIEALDRRHRQALHAALQLPAVLDGRDQAAARRQPARDRPRPPGRARARRAMLPARRTSLHDPHRLGDPRVERQLVDGVGLRRHRCR